MTLIQQRALLTQRWSFGSNCTKSGLALTSSTKTRNHEKKVTVECFDVRISSKVQDRVW